MRQRINCIETSFTTPFYHFSGMYYYKRAESNNHLKKKKHMTPIVKIKNALKIFQKTPVKGMLQKSSVLSSSFLFYETKKH